MIGLNPLRRPVLITTDEVLFHAPTDASADVRMILQNIIVAELRFIKPMLCPRVYDTLIAAKNTLVTSGNKATLQTALNTGRSANRETIVLAEGDYVNSDTYLNAAQKALWNQCLHKLVAECVYFMALPVNRSRFTAKGVEKNNPEGIAQSQDAVAVDLRDLKHLMDKSLKDRIAPLMEDLHQYMCKVNYPGYCNDCNCDSDGIAYRGKSDIIFGMYDDQEGGCRSCR